MIRVYNGKICLVWLLGYHDTITFIRAQTDRPIIFRPHPRVRYLHIEHDFKDVKRQTPKHIQNTYDDFDMQFDNIWATVSWSSNPGIHSVINGVPAFTGPSSLAFDVAEQNLRNIEILYTVIEHNG